MKLQEVINRALTDPTFADELKNSAHKAAMSGVGGKDWEQFMSHFASDPAELANLRILSFPTASKKAATTTTLTTCTTLTSMACTTTTTTTTTSVPCP